MTRFIDSNIFIYVLTEDPNYCKTAKAILHRVDRSCVS